MSQYTLTSPLSFQWTHPVTWLNPTSAGRGNLLCFQQEELQNHLQRTQAGPASGRATHADAPGPYPQEGPTLAERSAVSCVRLLINFCHGSLNFHFSWALPIIEPDLNMGEDKEFGTIMESSYLTN